MLRLVEAALALSGTALGELDAIVVSRGPGSLTGLRVGIGTARGIATGAGRPLAGVSTLQALACSLGEGLPVLALIDAGRGEVYGGLFRPGNPPQPMGDERVGPPEAFVEAVRGREVRIAGSGAIRYATLFGRTPEAAAASGPFLALGAARIAMALMAPGAPLRRRDRRRGPSGPLDPAPRYLRRAGAPVRFEG